jgi:hypothetical protein
MIKFIAAAASPLVFGIASASAASGNNFHIFTHQLLDSTAANSFCTSKPAAAARLAHLHNKKGWVLYNGHALHSSH